MGYAARRSPDRNSGKALAAYAAMVSTEALDYEKVKRAVLHRYDVNEETHRLRFRQEQKRPEESYRAWVCRSTDHFDKWMKDQEMSLREVIIMEQVLMGVPEDMAVWLKERKPKSLDELGTLADDYVLARRSEGVRPLRPTAPGLRQGPGRANAFVKEEQPRPSAEGRRVQVNTRGDKRCYICGRWGHLSYSCPNRGPASHPDRQNSKALFAEACQDIAWNEDSFKYLRRGTVDGRPAQMLVDTGSDRTIVSAGVVRGAKMDAGNKVPVLCVHGDVCSYPTAEVELVSGSWRKKARVAVAPNLPVAVLLGRDVYNEMAGKEEVVQGLVAVTRSQTKKAEEEREREEAKEREATMTSLPLWMGEEGGVDEGDELGKEAVMEEGESRGKDPGITAVEEELEEPLGDGDGRGEAPGGDEAGGESGLAADSGGTTILSASPGQIREWQLADPSLSHMRELADGEAVVDRGNPAHFHYQDGLLYRTWRPRGAEAGGLRETEQLVLPKECREVVLRLSANVGTPGGDQDKEPNTAALLLAWGVQSSSPVLQVV